MSGKLSDYSSLIRDSAEDETEQSENVSRNENISDRHN